MAIIKTDSANYENAAAKIREKTNGTNGYKPSQLPAGIDEVYEAGKKAEYDALWDKLQNNGGRANYMYRFAYNSWDDKTYNPKYNIETHTGTTAGQYIFYSSTEITDTKVDIIINASSAGHAFGKSGIKTIRRVWFSENTSFNNTFLECEPLENVVFDGVIGVNGLNLQWSTKLTHESLMSLINTLADKSTDTSGTVWKVTIGETNRSKLTAEELEIAEQKGWNIV